MGYWKENTAGLESEALARGKNFDNPLIVLGLCVLDCSTKWDELPGLALSRVSGVTGCSHGSEQCMGVQDARTGPHLLLRCVLEAWSSKQLCWEILRKLLEIKTTGTFSGHCGDLLPGEKLVYFSCNLWVLTGLTYHRNSITWPLDRFYCERKFISSVCSLAVMPCALRTSTKPKSTEPPSPGLTASGTANQTS